MLFGSQKIQEEILSKVREFENQYNKKVVYGTVLGSISQGIERYDSDYDSRFLYFDKMGKGYARRDQLKEKISEKNIHYYYIPEKGYIDGISYRDSALKFGEHVLSYDKIAFWELTSYVSFLDRPQLDGKFSVGLYHRSGWTFQSPFCWDPYGIQNKISCLVDEMFILKYEVQYYENYILKILEKKEILLKEYLCAAYYALAIQYCIREKRFAPTYFKTLFAFCNDKKIKDAILRIEKKYYLANVEIMLKPTFQRKMSTYLLTEREPIIDELLISTSEEVKEASFEEAENQEKSYIGKIIDMIINSLENLEAYT